MQRKQYRNSHVSPELLLDDDDVLFMVPQVKYFLPYQTGSQCLEHLKTAWQYSS